MIYCLFWTWSLWLAWMHMAAIRGSAPAALSRNDDAFTCQSDRTPARRSGNVPCVSVSRRHYLLWNNMYTTCTHTHLLICVCVCMLETSALVGISIAKWYLWLAQMCPQIPPDERWDRGRAVRGTLHSHVRCCVCPIYSYARFLDHFSQFAFYGALVCMHFTPGESVPDRWLW